MPRGRGLPSLQSRALALWGRSHLYGGELNMPENRLLSSSKSRVCQSNGRECQGLLGAKWAQRGNSTAADENLNPRLRSKKRNPRKGWERSDILKGTSTFSWGGILYNWISSLHLVERLQLRITPSPQLPYLRHYNFTQLSNSAWQREWQWW